MYKTVLVPLDGSDNSECVLNYVEDFAKRYKAKVVFLKVEEGPSLLGRDEVLVDQKKENAEFEERAKSAESYLITHQEKFRKKRIETDTQVAYSYGFVEGVILGAAKKHNADLIAMASSHHKKIRFNPYESVAVGICALMDRPLVLIPLKN